jgi:hypothetical protein
MAEKEDVSKYIQEQLELVQRLETILETILNDHGNDYNAKHHLVRAIEYRDKSMRYLNLLKQALESNRAYKTSR